MYHDQTSKNVWRSGDEGATWNIIEGVPLGSASMVLDHPYDSKIVSLVFTLPTRKPLTRIIDFPGLHSHFRYEALQNNGSRTQLGFV